MENNRSDSFLRLIQRSRRGKLKIYLGYCAGVGKTFQMLQEARRMKENGIDVVIGIVETHGRKETEALLAGLETVPRKSMVYRGIEITEMDIDTLLQRQPSVVLIDELAHTNVPGSRNAKRYEDVEEILASGIHVISTLNIQHLESLYETVEQATGIKVRERVPDRILTMADQLVNVDCTTDDLRQRLKEGKVYVPERTETALANFFRTENLEQLRELSLRELAAQIDSRRRNQPIEESQSNPDQLMVCLNSKSRNCETLLRYASRIAGRLNRNWYAVYVETFAETHEAIEPSVQRMLSNTLILAQNLGATVFNYKGDDVVKTILQFAHEYRVGNIIIGNSGRKLSFWQRATGKKTLVEQLIAECRGASVIVLDTRDDHAGTAKGEHPLLPLSSIRKNLFREARQPEQHWKELVRNAKSLLWETVIEKEQAFRELLHECCRLDPEIDEEEAMRCILEREMQGSTFIGEEIAIPHAWIRQLKNPLVAVGISKVGIYDPNSSNTARIMFLVLSPVTDPTSHVKPLGIISKIASDSQWKNRVLQAANRKELLKTLRNHP